MTGEKTEFLLKGKPKGWQKMCEKGMVCLLCPAHWTPPWRICNFNQLQTENIWKKSIKFQSKTWICQALATIYIASTLYFVIYTLSHVWLFYDPKNCRLPGSSVHGISPGKNTSMGCHFLLQGIFLTQGLNLGILLGRQILYHWATRETHIVFTTI